jgi:hypothetical protein
MLQWFSSLCSDEQRGLNMRSGYISIGLFFGVAAISAQASAQTISPSQVSLIGVSVIPFGATFDGTPVGGLSGLDYNPLTGQFVAISDDRSQNAPARFYTLNIPVTASSVGPVTFTGVTTLKDASGNTYAPLSVDPESIRYAPGGGYLWSSEGGRSHVPPIDASVQRIDANGRLTQTFTTPSAFLIGTNHGIRDNLAFEGVTYTPDDTSVFVSTESAVFQDGPDSTVGAGTVARITRFDPTTGVATAEYAYDLGAIPFAPTPPGGSANNGISEILALDDTDLLVMERAFAQGVGNTIRIYEISTAGATNVIGDDSLIGATYTPVEKTLLVDLSSLGVVPDNVEGMTFGPDLANGDRTLELIVDNNFSSTQTEQLIALAISPTVAAPELSTWAMMLAGMTSLAGLTLMRRQART